MRLNYIFLIIVIISLFVPRTVHAIEDPLKKPNNKYGIHILFDTELADAARLVNSNGGDWGYVTIPIQASDRDLFKWQRFMDNAKSLHLIPILRLATEGDYFNTAVWRRPTPADILDFANFLDSLNWPVKNRYIIVFNEVNRGDEWGGAINPNEYANILSYAVSVFKSKNQDYFILSAGLDNAAPSIGSDYMNEYSYMQNMNQAVPGIFNQVDGMTSHSYPNPGFSSPPTAVTGKSIASFLFESQLVDSMTTKQLPIFITETGWNAPGISPSTEASYYTDAFQNVWSNPRIVAVTPFLLRANAGPFGGFGFINSSGGFTEQYKTYAGLSKVKGEPTVMNKTLRSVLGTEINEANLPTRYFESAKPQEPEKPIFSSMMKSYIKWMLHM